MPKFTGFPPGTLRFLRELERNNDREWFAVNKPRYEALVCEPALDFIATMGPRLLRISDHFVALPKKTGGSLMRVYRHPGGFPTSPPSSFSILPATLQIV